MATLSDLTKYKNLPQLHRENMIPLLVAFAQAPFVIEDVLTVIPSTDDFVYEQETYTTKFNRPLKRQEKAEAQVNAFQVEKKTGSAWEYFEQYPITSKTLRKNNVYEFINVMVKGMDIIANKIRLGCELDGLEAMLNASGINTATAAVIWSSASTCDPYLDIVKSKNKIELDELVEANAVILGTENYNELKTADAIRDTQAYTNDYTEKGIRIKEIDGSRIYVASARYNVNGTLTPVLTDKAIVTVAGFAGELKEASPYDAWTVFDAEHQIIKLFGNRVMAPSITKPKAITELTAI